MLAEKLRAFANDEIHPVVQHTSEYADELSMLYECANEITRLTAENERLRQEVEHYNKSGIVEIAVRNPSVADYMAHWEGRAEKAEAENERLREALRPFAELTPPAEWPDSDTVHVFNTGWVAAGDFRRARAALEQP